MLDVIAELKGSKKRRIESSVEQSVKRLTKWAVRVKSNADIANNPMRLSLKELLQAEQNGRWWILGGTWAGYQQPTVNDAKQHVNQTKLMQLATKQRMNTDIRK